MEEKKKHKVMTGIEVILLGMIIAIVGTNAASSNPPSNGVSYSKNSQTTVEGALNDLYNKANYGNAGAGQIMSGKTALVGGKQVTGTMPDRGLAQYGSWGCGDAGCGSGEDAYYSINALPEGYYHSDGNWWAPEARINANTLRSSLGITANKILKGQSIAGINGTGETSCPSCSSCCPTCPSCPPSIVSATFIDSGDFSDSITKEISAEVGAYYLLYKGATTNNISNDSFSGCDVLLVERTNGQKYNINGNTIQLRSIVALVKATSNKITISTSNPKGKGYLYAKISN